MQKMIYSNCRLVFTPSPSPPPPKNHHLPPTHNTQFIFCIFSRECQEEDLYATCIRQEQVHHSGLPELSYLPRPDLRTFEERLASWQEPTPSDPYRCAIVRGWIKEMVGGGGGDRRGGLGPIGKKYAKTKRY